jgi:hypothetical protein
MCSILFVLLFVCVSLSIHSFFVFTIIRSWFVCLLCFFLFCFLMSWICFFQSVWVWFCKCEKKNAQRLLTSEIFCFFFCDLFFFSITNAPPFNDTFILKIDDRFTEIMIGIHWGRVVPDTITDASLSIGLHFLAGTKKFRLIHNSVSLKWTIECGTKESVLTWPYCTCYPCDNLFVAEAINTKSSRLYWSCDFHNY